MARRQRQPRTTNDTSTEDILLIIVALFFPPITALIAGGCGHFCLNILLTLLGFIPGLIHAIWLVLRDRNQVVQQQPQHYVYVDGNRPQQQQVQPVYTEQQPQQQHFSQQPSVTQQQQQGTYVPASSAYTGKH